jgi:hypothetical protein
LASNLLNSVAGQASLSIHGGAAGFDSGLADHLHSFVFLVGGGDYLLASGGLLSGGKHHSVLNHCGVLFGGHFHDLDFLQLFNFSNNAHD